MRLFSARKAPPPVPAIVAAPRDERQERWRRLTLEGNLALEQREDVRARQCYEEALGVADALMADAVLAGDPLAVQVAPLLHGCACNNIAELARMQGDRETAGFYLYRRVSCLISVMESSRAPLDLRLRCLLHLKIASGGVYEYFEHGGMWDAAAAFTERVNAAMFTVQRLEAAAGHAPAVPEQLPLP